MTDMSDRATGLPINRREFMTRAAVAMGAAATLAAMTRNLPFSPFKKRSSGLSSADSIFLPRPGSRLRYWRNKLDLFRLLQEICRQDQFNPIRVIGSLRSGKSFGYALSNGILCLSIIKMLQSR